MLSRRHVVFNLSIIMIPWFSLLFIGKRSFKRYGIAGAIISIFEITNHLYGRHKKWWKFYDQPKSFIRDELPFDIGPYMPVSLWILKYSYGNFKKFILLNALFHMVFAWVFLPFLKKVKIVRLTRISYFQFFLYIHYKAYLLYALQHLIEKMRFSR
ncbi:hypothetical protein [Bacillus infantis]|uniref:hypothetical protein n=1 Tax=Bacillus infantis TaxID=324767 RepID=UPI0013EA8CA5|nr:hypothetical protein [Bacillus infantis]